MKNTSNPYVPVEGKTYSLFGNSESSSGYYSLIGSLADKILEKTPDARFAIEIIARYSSRKHFLRKVLRKPDQVSLLSGWLNFIHPQLKKFTEKTEIHLKELSPFKFWDRRLGTTREQYHLYMLEIELNNRTNAELFKKADKKISLQPYCLQDFSTDCKASNTGFDYQCKHCSKICFQNHASILMNKYHIDPYIWMGLNLKQFAKKFRDAKQSFAVIGIACIPELLWGLRKCRRYNIPAIGIPLNANRCIRWFGEFHPNSIDLEELEKLLGS